MRSIQTLMAVAMVLAITGCKSLDEKIANVEQDVYEYSVTDMEAILAVHGEPDHVKSVWEPNPWKAYPGDPSMIRYEIWRYQEDIEPIADYVFTFHRGYLYDWIIVYSAEEMPAKLKDRHVAYYDYDTREIHHARGSR